MKQKTPSTFAELAHQAGIRLGARIERRAMRDMINRRLRENFRTEEDGLRQVKSWLSGRIERTKKPGGVGR